MFVIEFQDKQPLIKHRLALEKFPAGRKTGRLVSNYDDRAMIEAVMTAEKRQLNDFLHFVLCANRGEAMNVF